MNGFSRTGLGNESLSLGGDQLTVEGAQVLNTDPVEGFKVSPPIIKQASLGVYPLCIDPQEPCVVAAIRLALIGLMESDGLIFAGPEV
ncbi:MAG: hypothetical protein M0Q43_10735, partial [Methanothrix sp.]|nr:hypothetical protein [Methanothrix sp.]